MSVGLRCVADEFDFICRGSKNEKPHLVSPNGKVIELEVRDYVPYLCSKSQHPNVSAVASSNHVENPMPRVKVMASSSRPNQTHDEDDEPSLLVMMRIIIMMMMSLPSSVVVVRPSPRR